MAQSGPRFFVDRLEGDTAVLIAASEPLLVPVSSLPTGTGEGTWLKMDGEWVADPASEAQVLQRVDTLQKALLSKDDGGDIEF